MKFLHTTEWSELLSIHIYNYTHTHNTPWRHKGVECVNCCSFDVCTFINVCKSVIKTKPAGPLNYDLQVDRTYYISCLGGRTLYHSVCRYMYYICLYATLVCLSVRTSTSLGNFHSQRICRSYMPKNGLNCETGGHSHVSTYSVNALIL